MNLDTRILIFRSQSFSYQIKRFIFIPHTIFQIRRCNFFRVNNPIILQRSKANLLTLDPICISFFECNGDFLFCRCIQIDMHVLREKDKYFTFKHILWQKDFTPNSKANKMRNSVKPPFYNVLYKDPYFTISWFTREISFVFV